ncbi:UbiA prenyltransferase family [Dillenia turbinata]|uniref:UbiA prenyltransferase family n=1 Tax=Dillenia turbinata TaxID=194707 RepID=A0AAN8V2D1_9MAGN
MAALLLFRAFRRNPSIITCHHFIPNLFNFSQKLGFSDLSSADETSKLNKSGETEELSPSSPSWIDLYLPEQARSYAKLARLDKPIGTWFLAWPCMSITLAGSPGSLPDVNMLTLFGCGALLLRGAGCTINDLLDRDIDTKVKRIKLRTVASGLLSPFQGLCFLRFLLLLGLGILLQLNNYSKLRLLQNLGSSCGNLDPLVVRPLYVSGVCWTLVYDTIYAHQLYIYTVVINPQVSFYAFGHAMREVYTLHTQDKEDDLKVGMKSTALRLGESTTEWITGFATACIASLAISGYNADIGWSFYASLLAASMQLGWQIRTVDLSSHIDCNRNRLQKKIVKPKDL